MSVFIEYDLQRLAERWEVPERPHCSNCLHARVAGSAAVPLVYCERGHGPASIQLGSLIRSTRPRQFQPAAGCPDFESMGEACNLGHPAVKEGAS